jgi:hypothetical protein
MQGKHSNPLERLAGLVNGDEPVTAEAVEKMEQQDRESVEDINAVLKFVSARRRVNADIFVMQELVEACAEELRIQIRDMVEGEDDEG